MKPVSRTLIMVIATVAILSALGATACTQNAGNTVASVNGSGIDTSEVQSQIERMKKVSPQYFKGSDAATREAELKAQIVNSLIQTALLRQGAKDKGVVVDQKAVDAYIATLEKQYGGAAGLASAMKTSGVTIAQLRQNIADKLLGDALGAKLTVVSDPTTDQIKAYYTKYISQFTTQRLVHAEHILIASNDKAKALKVLDLVKNSGQSFAALAKQYSIDGSKDKGGDLGLQVVTTYVKEFADAVSAMKVNEVRLVQSPYGWHIIKLLSTQPPRVKPLTEAWITIKQNLINQARAKALQDYLSVMKSKANIQITDPALKAAIDAVNAPSSTNSK